MTNDSDTAGPAWFTIREAAAYLQVGEPTLYRWMRDGRITYRKVGDSTRFLKEDLEAVVEVFPSRRDATHATAFCPFCHDADLVPGSLRTTGAVSFYPSQTRFWTLKDSAIAVEASMCARCGHVVIHGDVAKLQAIRGQLAETTAKTAEPEAPRD